MPRKIVVGPRVRAVVVDVGAVPRRWVECTDVPTACAHTHGKRTNSSRQSSRRRRPMLGWQPTCKVVQSRWIIASEDVEDTRDQHGAAHFFRMQCGTFDRLFKSKTKRQLVHACILRWLCLPFTSFCFWCPMGWLGLLSLRIQITAKGVVNIHSQHDRLGLLKGGPPLAHPPIRHTNGRHFQAAVRRGWLAA